MQNTSNDNDDNDDMFNNAHIDSKSEKVFYDARNNRVQWILGKKALET